MIYNIAKVKGIIFRKCLLGIIFFVPILTYTQNITFEIYPLNELFYRQYLDSNQANIDPIEGIWTANSTRTIGSRVQDNHSYATVAIVKDITNSNRDFIEVILSGEGWEKKSVTAYFNKTAYSGRYTSKQFNPKGSSNMWNFSLEESGVLRASRRTVENYFQIEDEIYYIKVYPTLEQVVSRPRNNSHNSDNKRKYSPPIQKKTSDQKTIPQNNVEKEPENPNVLPLGTSPFGYNVRGGNSTLTVKNGTQTDALVRVISILYNNEMVRDFYIPSDKNFTADQLPPGKYVIRIAFGKDWNSKTKRFNFQKSFSESEMFDISENKWNEKVEDGYIEHTEASQLSITLHKVPFGNFTTHPISEEQFWK